MTPTVIHRYTFPVADAIRALVGDTSADRKTWSLHLVDGAIVIEAEIQPDHLSVSDVRVGDVSVDEFVGALVETAPAAEEPELKGGKLAQRAAMMCNERGFWTFSETESAEQAADWLRELCGVKSRKELDHKPAAAREFEKIDGKYRRWLQGFDD